MRACERRAARDIGANISHGQCGEGQGGSTGAVARRARRPAARLRRDGDHPVQHRADRRDVHAPRQHARVHAKPARSGPYALRVGGVGDSAPAAARDDGPAGHRRGGEEADGGRSRRGGRVPHRRGRDPGQAPGVHREAGSRSLAGNRERGGRPGQRERAAGERNWWAHPRGPRGLGQVHHHRGAPEVRVREGYAGGQPGEGG